MREKVDEKKEMRHFFYIYIISDHNFWVLLNVLFFLLLMFCINISYVFILIYIFSLSFTVSLSYILTFILFYTISSSKDFFCQFSGHSLSSHMEGGWMTSSRRHFFDNFSGNFSVYNTCNFFENWKCQRRQVGTSILGA